MALTKVRGAGVGTLDSATITSATITNQLTDANMSAGSVIQVVSVASSTQLTTSSAGSYIASSHITLSITPSSTSSKILTILSPSLRAYENGGSNANMRFALSWDGGSSFLYQAKLRGYDYGNSGILLGASISQTFLDSPSSTSALTYTMYVKMIGGSAIEINPDGNNKSTLTLIEIAGWLI